MRVIFSQVDIYSPMAVSKSNNVEKTAPSCNSDATRQTQHACAELKNRIRAHPHVRLGHGSKDTAHVRVDTSIAKPSWALMHAIFYFPSLSVTSLLKLTPSGMFLFLQLHYIHTVLFTGPCLL